MKKSVEKKDACGCSAEQTGCCASGPPPLQILPMAQAKPDSEPCCGAPAGPPSSPFERPGYMLCHYVDSFMDTNLGPVPKIKTSESVLDFLGAVRARLGIARDQYKVAPGLYAIGDPTPDSPVLVSANYKLSFDALRKELFGVDAWLLVLDTRGINVWCAAGKKTFGTDELVRQVKRVALDKVINHRELIVPQLGAPGVSAPRVKRESGFTVVWGPLRAEDIPDFLDNGRKADPEMRQLTFTMAERLVLIPVEISLIIKPSLWIVLALFVLSGIGSDIFSFAAAWKRGLDFVMAYGAGVFAGAVLVPALLPWLPWRSFYLKGIVTALLCGVGGVALMAEHPIAEVVAMAALSVAVSSYAAMNFTGATPYTSPSGVEKEMRQGIPLQIFLVVVSLVLWLGTPFGLNQFFM